MVSEIIDFLETEKLFEIVCIFKRQVPRSRFMVISSEDLQDKYPQFLKTFGIFKTNYGILSKVEGLDTANWVLIDSGDILVNIFRPEVREYYQLEKMWMYN